MAEAMTYTSLVQDLQVYAERSDDSFTSQIPRFIMMAENRLASEVHGLGYLRYAESILIPGEPTLQKPARWRETSCFSITVENEVNFLKQRSYTYCRMYWPNKTLTNIPRFYCDYGYEHFLLVATPDTAYPFELAYHERPIPLDETNQTNWTTQYAPQLLLYAALLEAQPWLKLDERIAVFQGMYDRAVSAVMNESQRRLNGDEALMRNEG